MNTVYNIYCDESCHLENDHQRVMVLGAVWCPLDKKRSIFNGIREVKKRHGLNANFEFKWTKVSPAKKQFYIDIIEYFFNNEYLHFRSILIPDKTLLKHKEFKQDHDSWYYKMYFNMLKVIMDPSARYRIYIDIKDTRGSKKISKLHDVLCNNVYDFERKIIERVQIVCSHEVELLQLTDLLIGLISYLNRGITSSEVKLSLINRMKVLSRYSLTKSTLLMEKKVNLFRWHASFKY